jgi:glycosyltransferase involved in cell wall biosynthesis
MNITITSSIAPKPGGGVPNVEYYLIAGLLNRGHRVIEYFPKTKSMFVTDLIKGLSLPKNDIINSHSNISWNTPGAIKMFHGVTALGEEIGNTEGDRVLKKGLYFTVNKFMEAQCVKKNYCLAVSQYVADALIKYYGADPKKIMVVHNGVDTDKFYPCDTCKWENREELGIPKDAFVVGSCGTFEFNKGFHYLREVINYCSHNKNIYFLIKSNIKDAEIPEQYKWILNTPNVKFLNHGGEMNEFYNTCDIFLSNSPYEPMSLAILEAMSCAKPVIAPNSGGHIEAIENEKSGIIIDDYHNTPAMANMIEYLEKHKADCKKMGRAARKRILDKFTTDHMVNGYINAFKKFGGSNV